MRSLIILSLVGLAAGCSTTVNKAFYQPTSKVYRTPDKDDLDYEDVAFASADGTVLTGWFIPATYEPRGTVIHFHGNARNMTSHYRYVGWIADEGFNVFVFDYRGYGRSAGTPGRKGVYEDCVAAVRYLQQRDDVDPEKIIVIGQGLGGANAIAVVGRENFDGILGIVAEAPFAASGEIVTDRLAAASGSPGKAAGSDAYSAAAVVDQLGVPLIVIHGTADRVVPYRHGKRLFDKAKEPKQIWTIKGGRHCDGMTIYHEKVRPRLLRIFRGWATAGEKKSFR
ncbi:MAG: alpha/beta hydrolase [Lentisphaeria bacterium]|jgi:hypothetical protein|nr:alpha/beta hydrolase [Lentisphaeria bacterium]MDP7740442.1 alpha/beta hydrolase [Lentisphaeria bacterium]